MSYRILLVDDDANVRAGLSRALHSQHYEIFCAGSGEEALKMLPSLSADVIISDEQMPGMSGTAFLKQTRALYPDTIRFILTGKATLPVAVQAINEGGISRFFLKPCDKVDLAVSIKQELEKRELMLAARRLLHKVKQQSSLIEELEKEYPQITEVRRDEDGAVIVEDVSEDIGTLISEICRQLDGG